LELERIRGREVGDYPTPDGEILAEYFAHISIGFSEIPEDAPRKQLLGNPTAEQVKAAPFDPGQLRSIKLVEALYIEVVEYWRRLRQELDAPETISV
jgi:hypothetical protein